METVSSQLFARARRHSISVCDLTTLERHQSKIDKIDIDGDIDNEDHDDDDDVDDDTNLDMNTDTRDHVAKIWAKTEFGKSLECLSLTLKEVQHIRSVLTKAEIESLGVTKSLRRDLVNNKICFQCLKTRFMFWGPWAIVCKLCNRSICER